ncbi:MAG TPA: S-layer family protein [Crinalium sp.]
MSQCYLEWWLIFSSALYLLMSAHPIAAQVIGDDTLAVEERSRVTGNVNVLIEGGARRGSNLFHSFSEFSIPAGHSAFFNNPADVTTIFSRVTGHSRSSIDGLIRANGVANVFLLNPNGIVFGANARLDIGGSFVASTANRIHFSDGISFNATTDANTSALLTVSVPIGLQFNQHPGTIQIQGPGHDLSVQAAIRSPTQRSTATDGLRVQPGRTLALIGGNISLQGGTLTAEQGRIELGSVGRGEAIALRSLSQGLALDYSNVNRFGAIRLSHRALADASRGGSIHIQGNRVSLAGASQLLIQNQDRQQGGRLSVRAHELLDIRSTSRDGRLRSGLDTQTLGEEAGAEIAIATPRLVVRNGAAITTRSFGRGASGNVTIRAANSIQVLGFSAFDRARSSTIGAVALDSGDAGNITLFTRRLTLRDGGSVAVSTLGNGDGGALTVNAHDSVDVIGVRNNFLISNIAAITQGDGHGGQVIVNTARLRLHNGGTVSSSTVAAGRAGNVIVNARDSVEIDGAASGQVTAGVVLPSSIQASAPIVSAEFRDIFQLPPTPSGFSGNVVINSDRLRVTNGANLAVNNQGLGNAGTLRVNTNQIILDRRGTITSATTSGEGGDMTFHIGNVLLMRRHSQITASASGSGNGGNMAIDAPLLVAVPNEDSDIRANSFNATGGNITVNAVSILGIQLRNQDTPLSDISATGANSALNGTVQLNVERFTPLQELVELPSTIIDATHLISQRCSAAQANSFVVTNRGGIAPSPEQRLGNPPPWHDRSFLPRSSLSAPSPLPFSTSPAPPLQEATEWQLSPTGDIILAAATPIMDLNQIGPHLDCGEL